MNLLLLGGIAGLGSCGAVLRVLVDTAVRYLWFQCKTARRTARRMPRVMPRVAPQAKLREDSAPAGGIWVVNISGCFLAGLLAGVLSGNSPALLLLGTGFLGGYTTFSTALVDVLILLRASRPLAASILASSTLIGGVLAACCGLVLGSYA